jgi:UDP:flavonoid glycosyltransferase YjiC (YdhE family)
MRVLVTTTPGTGHIYPVVPVARALRDSGHDVVWATSGVSCGVVERFGFAARPCGIDPDERTRRFMERYVGSLASVPPSERRALTFAGFFAEIAAPIMASGLVEIFDQVRPDLVVHEIAEMGVVPIATRHGVPRIVVAYSGALPPEVVEAAADAVRPLWDRFSLPILSDIGLYSHEYLHPFPPSLGQRAEMSAVHDVRPVPSEPAVGADEFAWLSRLGVERPLVYATFGTAIGAHAPWEQTLAAVARLNVDAVVTTGNRVDLAPLLAQLDETARSRIVVRDYVPQAWVLARAAVAVSHAGAGTMLGAGIAGIPQVALPMGADQFANADAFAAAGAAVTFHQTTAFDSDSLADQISLVLEGDKFRMTAAKLAADFAAMPHPDAVIAALTR